MQSMAMATNSRGNRVKLNIVSSIRPGHCVIKGNWVDISEPQVVHFGARLWEFSFNGKLIFPIETIETGET